MPNQWILAASHSASSLAAATNYLGFSGVAVTAATGEAARETYFSGTYTMRNLWVRVTTSTISAGAGTVRTRKNTANGGQSVSITGTGTFEDTTNTDSFAAADKGAIQIVGATTGAYTPALVSVILESATAGPLLLQTSTGQALTANVTHWPQIVGGLGKATASEAEGQLTARVPGTLSNLRGYLQTNPTATVTLKVRKNTVDGNQAVSWLSGVTGEARDASNSDIFAVGDLINYSWNNASATTSGSMTVVQTDLAAPSNWLAIAVNAAITQAEPLTRYYAWNGFMVAQATEADTQLKVRSTPTARNLYVRITTNAITAATTVTLRKNTADTALTVSVGSSATGTFEDTADTVPLVTTDLINMAVVTPSVSGTPTITLGYIAMQMDQQDTPELRGRPFGLHGQQQMHQLLSQ